MSIKETDRESRSFNPCGTWYRSWSRRRSRRLLFFGIIFTILGTYWLGRIYGFIQIDYTISRSIFPILLIAFGIWFLIASVLKKNKSYEK